MHRGGKKNGTRGLGGEGGGRQLEATVHTSLPPCVQGPLRAYVRVCLPSIHWDYSLGPPASKLCVGMRWWGEESPGTVFRVPVVHGQRRCSSEESTTLAFFPVRSALPQLSAYLKDMKSLKLRVGLGHMTDDSMVIGQSTLPDLSMLTESQPYNESLPIIGTQGHRLGRLHVQVELQVARAGQTSLTTSAAVPDDLSQPPEFRVGPGAQSISEKQREPMTEMDTRKRLAPREHRTSSPNTNGGHPDPTESAASHKAALLAKYINPWTERGGRPPVQKPATASTGIENRIIDQSPSGERGYTGAVLGPKTQEVIAELIERGERLREAMARAILDSGIPAGMREGRGGREEREGREGREEREGKKEREEREGRKEKRERRVGRGECVSPLGGVDGELYSSECEEEEDGDVSMEESDYPLRDPSLLEKLLYCRDVDEGKKTQDSGTQTVSPATISTAGPSDRHPNASSNDAHLPPSSPPPSHPSQVGETGGGSLSTLASFFSGHSLQKSTDAEILEAVGVERLTLLGRVNSCRVVVEILEVDPQKMASVVLQGHSEKKKKRQSHSGPLSTTLSGTFFVEYHFPVAVAVRGGRGRKGGLFPPPHEVVRVASKRIKKRVVCFGHRSVFRVSLVGPGTRQWWHDFLIFTIYYRPPTHRTPCLVGKARVPFRQWLMAGATSTVVAPVTTSISLGGEGGREGGSDEESVGKLTVCLQLLCGKGNDREVLNTDSQPPAVVGMTLGEREGDGGCVRERGTATGETGGRERELLGAAPPIRVTEAQTISAKDIDRQSKALQLLLMIPEATDVTLPPPPTSPHPPSSSSSSSYGAPNCYLVCRLFCANPHPRTPTIWASTCPQFNFKQVFPLYLTPSLLDKVCNNFTVVEVWHKTPGTNTHDELLGLVKLSLHQFYLAFSEDSSTSLSLSAQLPVVAVDNYCPVVSPFTGNEQGHLAVLLAMGSAQQVTEIQQQIAVGNYKLHRPFRKTHTLPHEPPVVHQIGGQREESDGEKSADPIHHTFTVRVSGVRGLSVFNNTVWGEADCFVQYHFPSLTNHPESGGRDREGEGEGCEVSLQAVRTDMTLCVPNPAFSHEVSHSLVLPRGHLVQREILRTIGAGGGLGFELWRRFYYPNIRDQLIAKASLPVAKLCALVSMQRIEGPTVQSFSLPMTLVDKGMQEGGSGGILEVTVQYQAQGGWGGREHTSVTGSDWQRRKSHVSLRVEVVRSTGLRDAASLAAQEQPVPLGFAAEVGTNCYAKVCLPGLIQKEGRCTKTVMRSFSPQFSHSLEFALPLVTRQTAPPYTLSLADRLAESSAVVEVWHKVPRTHSRPAPVPPGAVTGRPLAPVFRDVCLGQAVVPLITLLETHTGVSGWLPLYPPVVKPHTAPPYDDLPPSTNPPVSYVGGIEVSFSFSCDEDRELVLSRCVEMGWEPPRGGSTSVEGGQTAEREGVEADMKDPKTSWKFSVKVPELSVPMEAVTIDLSEDPSPYMYCFLRYRLFDSDVVLSVPRALSYSRDGRGYYQPNHHSTVTVAGSQDLEWYIGEESLEVEVWSSPSRQHRSQKVKKSSDERARGGRGGSTDSEDTLLGTAFLSLRGLLSRHSVSGSCPIFKAGEDSLGGRTVTIQVERSLVEPNVLTSSGSPQPTLLEILDVCEESGDSEADFVPLKPVSEEEGEEEREGGEEDEEKEKFEDMFEARLVVHQALHLPMMTDKTQEREWAPSAYVSVHPHPRVERIVTGAVSSSQSPLWNHHSITHIPNLYLDPHCMGLELQVWSQATGGRASPSSAPPSERQPEDMYIGCAHIDLSTLALGLSQITGWYNIHDFGGQIQGQLKVSVVPCPGWSIQSKPSHSLPPPHVLLSSVSPHLRTDPLAQSSSYSQAPSFMSKSSSVLLRKLRDDLNELDLISSAWPTNTGAEDMEPLSSKLLLGTPALPAVTEEYHGNSCTLTTTQAVSLSVSYSSSGPSLEQHSLSSGEPLSEGLKEALGRGGGIPGVLVAVTEPESGSGSCSVVSSPGKCLQESTDVASGEITLTNLEVSGSPPTTAPAQNTPPTPSPQDTPPTPSAQDTHPSSSPQRILPTSSVQSTLLPCCKTSTQLYTSSTSHKVLDQVANNSEGNSMSVEVEDDRSLELVSTTGSSLEGSETHSQLSDIISSCTDEEDTLTPRATTHCGDEKTTTATPTLNQLVLERTEETETDDRDDGFGQWMRAGGTVCSSVANSGSESVVTGAEHSRLSPVTEPQPPPTAPAVKPSAGVPEVTLPNFFMPPLELERAMRSMRASALARPPPRTLFQPHPHTPEEERDPSGSPQLHPTGPPPSLPPSIRTAQDVDTFLKSRRQAATTAAGHSNKLSDKDAQRLSRIFTSKPLQQTNLQ